jgi:transcriptional regulator with XRE-family HTH domain
MTEKDEPSVAIGLRLRAERRRMRLSLSQLAEKTGKKLSKSRISNDEQGTRRMGIEQAVIPAQALGEVSPIYLLCLEGGDAVMGDERELLRLFRRIDPRGKDLIVALARTEAGRHAQPDVLAA